MSDLSRGMDVFLDALATGDTSGAIERQEAREQRMAVSRAMLPIEGTIEAGYMREVWSEQLEALGFVFGEKVDDLFVNVTLPAGWSIKATGHSMHNDLVDDKGRKRGSYFYKGAFYDRNAHFYGLTRRYHVRDDYSQADDNRWRTGAFDEQAQEYVFATEWRARDDYAGRDADYPVVRAWLAEHYPDHSNALAYWEG